MQTFWGETEYLQARICSERNNHIIYALPSGPDVPPTERQSDVNLTTSPGAENATAVPHGTGGSRRTMLLAVDAAWPPISGGDLRNWQNAKAFAALGPVLAVSVCEPESRIKLDDPRIRTLALASASEIATSPRVAKRRTSVDTRIPEVALSRLLSAVREFKPDTIVIEGIPLFPLLAPLRSLVSQMVLDMHNLESDVVRQLTPRRSRLAALWSSKARNIWKVEQLELRASQLVDRVWVCSDQDRERLKSLSGGRTVAHVVPNGIPRFERIPERLVEPPSMPDGRPTVLFVGHLSYPPNVEAAQRLALQILPKLHSAQGGGRLIIAGRNPRRAVVDLAALPDVEIIANPEDLSALYRQAHLTIVPLVSGGGTRLKILEAMAWGVPVVATHLAAEGLHLVDGVDIALGETDEELAAQAAALCADPQKLMARRLRARETAVSHFSPAAIERAVRASLEGMDSMY